MESVSKPTDPEEAGSGADPATGSGNSPGSRGDDDERTPFREWPRAGRWAVYAVVGLVLLVVAGTAGGAAVVRRPLPQTEGSLRLDGLTGTVTVTRDGHGIPQLYADDADDLFYAQGFVHAQDRFWEMDYRRHLTSGRLAELLGKAAVASDLAVRTMGWRRVAEQELAQLSPETRDLLQAYSDGVNAYLARKSSSTMSLQLTVLGLGGLNYKPEPWTPADSLAWLKAVAWDQRSNVQEEAERARLALDRTPDQVAELFPPYPYAAAPPIVPDQGGSTSGLGSASTGSTSGRTAAGAASIGVDRGVGGSGWVVSGRRTTTGRPLLAVDPHLAPSQPGAFYQMGLHCRVVDDDCPYDVSGLTFSGFPGVVMGHNVDIAWGLTDLGADTADLFLEDVEGHTYLRDGRRVPLAEHDETIRVHGSTSRTFTVRATVHGPLLSDVSRDLATVGANAAARTPGRRHNYAVALAWTALRPTRTADAILALDRAGGWSDVEAAAQLLGAPDEGILFADRTGNIGYQAAGLVPVRKGGRVGDAPAAGWSSAQDWAPGTVPFSRMPRVVNPPDGVVVAADQAVAGPSYGLALGGSWDPGYRAARIRELLQAKPQLSVQDMARIQADTRNPMARVLVPHLMRVLLPSEYDADGQRLLATWDDTQPASSPAAAYFNVVWSNLLRLTFHDQLREALWPDGGPRWYAIVTRLLQEPTSPWWDDVTTDGVIENRDTILAEAMREARDELTRTVARDPGGWRWGRLHGLELRSRSVGDYGAGLVRALFNRGPYGVAGGNGSVDATTWDARDGYGVTASPSARLVVDLDDLDRSGWVVQSGQSAHPFSDHYRDQLPVWRAGRLLPWAFTDDAVRRAARDTLHLLPPG